MKCHIPFTAGLSLVACAGLALVYVGVQRWAQRPSSARLSFARVVCDVGEVPAGGKVVCEFPFTNGGGAILEVGDVQTGCGCMKAAVVPRRLDPGQAGVVRVEFMDASRPGLRFERALFVESNDPGGPVRLLVTGSALPTVVALPSRLSLGDVPPGECIRQRVVVDAIGRPRAFSVKSLSATGLEICGFVVRDSVPSDVFENTGSLPLELTPGSAHTIEFGVVSPTKAGPFQGQVTVHTDDEYVTSTQVEVLGKVVYPVSARPSRADFGLVQRGAARKLSVEVSTSAGVGGVQVGSPLPDYLSAQVRNDGGPNTWILDITLSPVRNGVHRAEVELQDASTGNDVLRIPVFALVTEP